MNKEIINKVLNYVNNIFPAQDLLDGETPGSYGDLLERNLTIALSFDTGLTFKDIQVYVIYKEKVIEPDYLVISIKGKKWTIYFDEYGDLRI